MYKRMNASDRKYVCGMHTQDRRAPNPLPKGDTPYGFVDTPVCQGRHTVNPSGNFLYCFAFMRRGSVRCMGFTANFIDMQYKLHEQTVCLRERVVSPNLGKERCGDSFSVSGMTLRCYCCARDTRCAGSRAILDKSPLR